MNLPTASPLNSPINIKPRCFSYCIDNSLTVNFLYLLMTPWQDLSFKNDGGDSSSSACGDSSSLFDTDRV